MSISVVIPVYNSASILPELVGRLEMVLESLCDNYELIVINDGSRDNSWNVICQLAEKYKWIRGINLMRNYGQHNALLCGIKAACFDIIVTMDDDLQHPPEEIPKLLSKLNEGCDVVYGTPERERHGFLRDIASRITKISLKTAMGIDTAEMVSAFRAFRANVKEAFISFQGSFVSIDVLLTWGASSFSYVVVRHDSRKALVSNYTFRKLIIHAFNMMTGFSTIPLQLASLLGVFVTVFGLLLFLFVFINYFIHGSAVPGFAFLASIICIFSGTQLLVLGVFGEYLARMHFRIMERPPYSVRERTSNER
jgi:glycosyltransferase involved in cell wall biosynthesis